MATALTKLTSNPEWTGKIRKLRDRLEVGIRAAYPTAFILGSEADRLPTTVFACLPGIDGDDLVDRLAAKGIAVSTGSACSFGASRPSHVALAHGLSYDQARSCVRFSLSIESTDEEVEFVVHVFRELAVPAGQKLETA
jgi:cysteine desulfurase